MIKLNRYQRLVYANPTIEGQHATHMPDGRLVHDETIDGQEVTVGITVDVSADNREHHDTDAVWMISVSVWPTSMAERLSHPAEIPIEVSQWTARHKEVAARAHGANVEGMSVGGEPDDAEAKGLVWPRRYSLHLRVPLNEEERRELPVEPR